MNAFLFDKNNIVCVSIAVLSVIFDKRSKLPKLPTKMLKIPACIFIDATEFAWMITTLDRMKNRTETLSSESTDTYGIAYLLSTNGTDRPTSIATGTDDGSRECDDGSSCCDSGDGSKSDQWNFTRTAHQFAASGF